MILFPPFEKSFLYTFPDNCAGHLTSLQVNFKLFLLAQVLIKSGLLIRFEGNDGAQVIRTQQPGKMSEQEIELVSRPAQCLI